MRWSWRVFSVRGVDVYVHATFLLLLGWILVLHVVPRQPPGTVFAGAAFVVLFSACVLLHELGHALAARRFGIRTREVTLYPIGGVARLERIPRTPGQELWIALAGPAVNLAIAALLFLPLRALHMPWGPDRLVGGNLLATLMWINVELAVFNLLPGLPMDGGRVLRARLARWMEYSRATRTAAAVGQGLAFLFGFLGLLFEPVLLFVALFVYQAAAQEAEMVRPELAFREAPVRAAMLTDFGTLSPLDPLARPMERLLAGDQHDFPVVDDRAVVGLLRREDLLRGLNRHGPGGTVASFMRPDPPTVAPDDTLETAHQRMTAAEVRAAPVVQDAGLVGLITLENIGDFVMVRAAIEGVPVAEPVEGTESEVEAGERRFGWPAAGRRARG